MGTPYIGEIRMFGGNFAPAGWAFCHGQLLAVAQNDALFSLIGTIYGGDGRTTFALPDLRGRLPVHQGSGFRIGQQGGSEQVTLTQNQMPSHSHALLGSADTATGSVPTNNAPAAASGATVSPYGTDAPLTSLNASSLPAAGGSQPHDNIQPYLCVNFIIALVGVYPSRA